MSNTNSNRPSTFARVMGYIVGGLPALMLIAGGIMSLVKPELVAKGVVEKGYPAHLVPWLGGIELLCAIIYLIPQTSVLGAILITGYLGGAVATHVRIEEQVWYIPVIVGTLPWIGLLLRDKRLRALLPFVK